MVKRRTYRKRRTGIFSRFSRSILSIVILSAFVLAVSLFVRGVSDLDTDKIVRISSPILARLGLSEERVGQVAGSFAERVMNTSIAPSVSSSQSERDGKDSRPVTVTEPIFKVALMGDSHDDNAQLTKALHMAKTNSVNHVFFLGDATNYGELESLQEAKVVLDNSGLSYSVLPGDHDLADGANKDDPWENFTQVFGRSNTTITIEGNKFVILDNSANHTPIFEDSIAWFRNEVTDADFVILAQPVFSPIVSVVSPVMGYVNGEEDEDIASQREEILEVLRNSKVRGVVAADHHRSSNSIDPERSTLEHIVVGAIDPSRGLQSPRFSILEVDEEGKFNIVEILLEE
ncbi:metallophosphoesterase family protein [Patescibacteria group bacterium]